MTVVHDITNPIPIDLSTVLPGAVSLPRGVAFGLYVGGIGLQLDVGAQTPYKRQSAPISKQQLDTSMEAGEQTLDGAWIRSQRSWHMGAGANWYEPGSKDSSILPTRYRFDDAVGVDVWTLGQATLLHSMDLAQAETGDVQTLGARDPSTNIDYVFESSGGVLRRFDAAGASTTYTGGAGTTRMASSGSKILQGHAGGIDVADLTGTTRAALYTQATGTAPTPFWVKARIIAAKGNELHELTLDGSTHTGVIDSTTAFYTHPDPNWVWTAVTESPEAIIAGGHAGGRSELYRFELNSSSGGVPPTLGGAMSIATLPPGEEVWSLVAYLGRFLGVGTSRGVRVGISSASYTGYIWTISPLIVKTTEPVMALENRDTYLYAAVTNAITGMSGAARIWLAFPLDQAGLIYPWAWDAQTHTTGTVNSLSFVGDTERVVLGVSGKGMYVQSATAYEPTGTLTSGQIRFDTIEPKSFQLLGVTCDTTAGSITPAFVSSTGSVVNLANLAKGSTGEQINLRTSVATPMGSAAYRMTLTAGTGTPVLTSVVFKALPAPKRQRLIQYPIVVSDAAKDQSGNPYGYEGYAFQIISALEALEEQQVVVTVVDARTSEKFQATIEQISFAGITPPSGPRQNWSGSATLTVRKW